MNIKEIKNLLRDISQFEILEEPQKCIIFEQNLNQDQIVKQITLYNLSNTT